MGRTWEWETKEESKWTVLDLLCMFLHARVLLLRWIRLYRFLSVMDHLQQSQNDQFFHFNIWDNVYLCSSSLWYLGKQSCITSVMGQVHARTAHPREVTPSPLYYSLWCHWREQVWRSWTIYWPKKRSESKKSKDWGPSPQRLLQKWENTGGRWTEY